MRYLKRFESVSNIKDINTLSNNYLAYLYDEGVRIGISDNGYIYKDSIYVELVLPDLSWDDIKDYIIPYIDALRNNYEFIIGEYVDNPVNFFYMDSDEETVNSEKSIDDIISDNMDNLDDMPIYAINFHLKE